MPINDHLGKSQNLIDVIVIGQGTPKGYQKLSVGAASVSLTIPTNANSALIVLEDINARWRNDNTAPTASEGLPLYANQSMTIDGELNLSQFKIISQSGTGTLYIAYFQKI